jgi:hypothetical protein
MGVVIRPQPLFWRGFSVRRFAFILLLTASIILVYLLVALRAPPLGEWSVAQLAHSIREGESKRLTLGDARGVAELTTGIRVIVSADAGQRSLIGSLLALGVTEEQLNAIEISHEEPGPGFRLADVLKWLFSVPIVISVLGLGWVLFGKAGRQGRTP